MILLTGDIHGDVRSPLWVTQKYGLTPDDILILLGDVGLNYYGADQGDRKRKKLLNKAGVPIFCIHGNHEERPFNIPSLTFSHLYSLLCFLFCLFDFLPEL